MIDGLIDLIDGGLEMSGSKIVVLRECGLERLKLALKLSDVDILRFPIAVLDRFPTKRVCSRSSNRGRDRGQNVERLSGINLCGRC